MLGALSCTFYVACGDDDLIIGTPTPDAGGGTGGTMGGTGGTMGGTGGTMGGTGGTMGGTGGMTMPDDAGTDASTDAGNPGDASPDADLADTGSTSNN
jgi:hypothetical protein